MLKFLLCKTNLRHQWHVETYPCIADQRAHHVDGCNPSSTHGCVWRLLMPLMRSTTSSGASRKTPRSSGDHQGPHRTFGRVGSDGSTGIHQRRSLNAIDPTECNRILALCELILPDLGFIQPYPERCLRTRFEGAHTVVALFVCQLCNPRASKSGGRYMPNRPR